MLTRDRRSKGNETSHTWACHLATVSGLTSPAVRDLKDHREGKEPCEGKGEPPAVELHETGLPRFQRLVFTSLPIAPGAQL